jgi:hypothetical protein
MGRFRSFFSELFRRKVVRVVGGYIAVVWLLAQGYASISSALEFENWLLWTFIAVAVAGIPFVAVMSWKYDVVPPQLVRDPKDLQLTNPGLGWARLRHDATDAGYVLLRWSPDGQTTHEKRFFQPIAIGREATNDIELADGRVSRHHAVLWAADGQWQLRDLDSANGTFVDGRRVNGTEQLPQSCELRFHANGPTVNAFIAKSAVTRVG